MAGADTQLAPDANDSFVVSDDPTDPDDSPFVARYKQHTRFATQLKAQDMKGRTSWGDRVSVTFDRTGDLVHRCMVGATITKGFGTAWYPMEALFSSIQLWFGGVLLEEHTPDWMRVYDEMYRAPDERQSYKAITNFRAEDSIGTTKTLYLPLLFWWCRDPSRALRLVSLEHHDIELVLTLATSVQGVDMSRPPILTFTTDYLFLDAPERSLLLRKPATQLVQVLERHEVDMRQDLPLHRIRLPFKDHCASLIWCCTGEAHGAFTTSGKPLEHDEQYAPVRSAQLIIAGTERLSSRFGTWHRVVEPFLKNVRAPSAGVYSFFPSARPGDAEEPSGSLDLGAFDDATLVLELKSPAIGAPGNDDTLAQGTHPLTRLVIFAQTWKKLHMQDGKATVTSLSSFER